MIQPQLKDYYEQQQKKQQRIRELCLKGRSTQKRQSYLLNYVLFDIRFSINFVLGGECRLRGKMLEICFH